MPRQVTVLTPGAGSVDPDTGNTRPGAMNPTATRAYLSQMPVNMLSSQVELIAEQNSVVSPYTLLVPPDVPLTAASEVVDEDQVRYRVIGQPAQRRGLGTVVLFQAAALHRISDLQN
jgi:hypothetical protein